MVIWWLYFMLAAGIVISTVMVYLLSFILDRLLLRIGWGMVALIGFGFMLTASIIDVWWILGHSQFEEFIQYGLPATVGGHWVLMVVVMINAEKIQEWVGYPIRTR